ncbi:MAG: YraN family protein [Patescibacteria group bacterium]
MPTKTNWNLAKQELGRRGETAARDYLAGRGYQIIESNYRSGRLEIDLIAQLGNEMIFIEIKTRNRTREGRDENPLTPFQAKNLKRAITAYCHKNRVNLSAARLDLIIILVDAETQKADLQHFRNIL